MIKLRYTKAKNIIIAVLTIAAAGLTSHLWFDRIANRSFFHTALAPFSASRTDTAAQAAHILKPYRIIVGYGDGMFNAICSDMADRSEAVAGNALLEAALENGAFAKADPLDWEGLLSQPLYLYQYTFNVPADFFVGVFNRRNVVNIQAQTDTFNAIALVPGRTPDESVLVAFIDETRHMMYTYSVQAESEALFEALAAGAALQDRYTGGVFYVSSIQADLAMLEGSHFIPQWRHAYAAYNWLEVSNPYAYAGSLLLEPIRRQVEMLFDNPDGIYPSRGSGGVYTYSNENTVVRYYANNVLEYISYSPPLDRSVGSSMAGDFLKAMAFLGKDRNVATDYYLSSVEPIVDGHIFYFDYTASQFPIQWPENFSSDIGLKSPIEITVENNQVFKYRKLVYNFEVGSTNLWGLGTSFLDVYDNLRIDADDALIQLDGVSLGYKMESADRLGMSWFMGMNGRYIVTPAQ